MDCICPKVSLHDHATRSRRLGCWEKVQEDPFGVALDYSCRLSHLLHIAVKRSSPPVPIAYMIDFRSLSRHSEPNTFWQVLYVRLRNTVRDTWGFPGVESNPSAFHRPGKTRNLGRKEDNKQCTGTAAGNISSRKCALSF